MKKSEDDKRYWKCHRFITKGSSYVPNRSVGGGKKGNLSLQRNIPRESKKVNKRERNGGGQNIGAHVSKKRANIGRKPNMKANQYKKWKHCKA